MLYYSRINLSEGINFVMRSALKSVLFVTIGISEIKDLSFTHLSVMVVMMF